MTRAIHIHQGQDAQLRCEDEGARLAYGVGIRKTARTAVGSTVWLGIRKVVTRSHVPGRREAIALRIPCFAQAQGNHPWLPVERMRSTHGGCGKNVVFFTPHHMTSRAHLGRMAFSNIARMASPE
jgi:hypothetical protein